MSQYSHAVFGFFHSRFAYGWKNLSLHDIFELKMAASPQKVALRFLFSIAKRFSGQLTHKMSKGA